MSCASISGGSRSPAESVASIEEIALEIEAKHLAETANGLFLEAA